MLTPGSRQENITMCTPYYHFYFLANPLFLKNKTIIRNQAKVEDVINMRDTHHITNKHSATKNSPGPKISCKINHCMEQVKYVEDHT